MSDRKRVSAGDRWKIGPRNGSGSKATAWDRLRVFISADFEARMAGETEDAYVSKIDVSSERSMICARK